MHAVVAGNDRGLPPPAWRLCFFLINTICDTEISNIHMPRSFTSGRLTVGFQQYATLIVLQYYIRGDVDVAGMCAVQCGDCRLSFVVEIAAFTVLALGDSPPTPPSPHIPQPRKSRPHWWNFIPSSPTPRPRSDVPSRHERTSSGDTTMQTRRYFGSSRSRTFPRTLSLPGVVAVAAEERHPPGEVRQERGERRDQRHRRERPRYR
jgi:hypothetical protein